MKALFNIVKKGGALMLVAMISCTEHLNLEPVSTISNASFWKTEDDATGAVAGMYVKLRNEAQNNLFHWGEARSEVMEWARLAGTLDYERLYENTLDAASSGPGWLGMYAAVDAANLIIKYVPEISFRQEASKNAVLAQAYTMRAFAYFTMVKVWGDVIVRTEPTEGYDVETIYKERSPKEEVMALVKEDIEKAIQLFPNNNFPNGRNIWSKAAANALKADIYLWTARQMNGGQADFTAALEACNQVQQTDVTLLPDFKDIFAYSNKGNKEIIMASRFQILESSDNYFNNMWIGAAGFPAGIDEETRQIIGAPGNVIVWQPSELVRNQFVAEDQRRNASFWEIYQSTSGERTYFATIVLKGQGIVEGGVRHFKNDVVLYRYADVLLMKAEAKNALGQDPSDEINQVRQRAYGANFSQHAFVNGSKDENDAAILKERLLELMCEGKRWWDLVRFGKAFDLVPSLQSRKGQDHLLLFPIGSNILSMEPKVQQNPGYN